MTSPDVSIIIANWQGEEWITRAISSLLNSARSQSTRFELVVVDDASTDDSVLLIRSRFPRVRLLENPRNSGFRRTINRGVRAARGKVVVLCNNDLSVKESFIPNLIRWFDPARRPVGLIPVDRPLFAVSARTVSWYDGTPNQVCMGAVWKGGRLTPAWSTPETASPCLFAQAGAAAYDRDLFLRLGGLSGLYDPGYWEDYDLSMRAARRGWMQLHDPEAIAVHVGGGSMARRFGADGVALMKARNHLIFEWRHLRSAGLIVNHAVRLPLALAGACLPGGPHLFPRAFFGALGRLPLILRERAADPNGPGPTDPQLLTPWKGFTPSY